MDQNTIITRRAALKREITAGQTLMEVIYETIGGWIQKITRGSNPASPFISTVLIYLLIVLIGYLITLVFREELALPIDVLVITTWWALSCAALLAALFNMRKLLDRIKDKIVDYVDSPDDLNDLQKCVTNQFFQLKKNISFSLVFGVILSLISTLLIETRSSIVMGVGFCTLLVISNILFGIPFYFIIMMLFVPRRLSRYQYHLYAVNPSRSQVVENLSGILNTYTYNVTIFVAVITLWVNLFFSSETIFNWFALAAVIINWIPIIIQFRTNHSTVQKIISKGKVKTLTEIQQNIEELHANSKFGDKRSINAINRLMDYHDRIARVRMSTFNLNAVVNLFNQLLIPIIAVVLANLEKLVGLISK